MTFGHELHQLGFNGLGNRRYDVMVENRYLNHLSLATRLLH